MPRLWILCNFLMNLLFMERGEGQKVACLTAVFFKHLHWSIFHELSLWYFPSPLLWSLFIGIISKTEFFLVPSISLEDNFSVIQTTPVFYGFLLKEVFLLRFRFLERKQSFDFSIIPAIISVQFEIASLKTGIRGTIAVKI